MFLDSPFVPALLLPFYPTTQPPLNHPNINPTPPHHHPGLCSGGEGEGPSASESEAAKGKESTRQLLEARMLCAVLCVVWDMLGMCVCACVCVLCWLLKRNTHTHREKHVKRLIDGVNRSCAFIRVRISLCVFVRVCLSVFARVYVCLRLTACAEP